VISRLCKNINGQSPAYTFAHDKSSPRGQKRYYKISDEVLDRMGLLRQVSSVELIPVSEDDHSFLILFDGYDYYEGRFVAFRSDPFGVTPSGLSRRTINLTAHNFNDKAVTALSVRLPQTAFTQHLGEQYGPTITKGIDDELARVSEVSRNGDITYTWAMWPGFARFSELVLIKVPLAVSVPVFGQYKAQALIYVEFFLRQDKTLGAQVVATSSHVDAGVFSGSVANRIRDELQKAKPEIDKKLADELEDLRYHKWTDVFLLPGRAPTDESFGAILSRADYSGHTQDDVSVVLVA